MGTFQVVIKDPAKPILDELKQILVDVLPFKLFKLHQPFIDFCRVVVE
jgi:hypothetical protein